MRKIPLLSELLALLPGLLLMPGCWSASHYSDQADHHAQEIIEQTQVTAFGEAEPFTIERPSETLRQKLLLGENLPISNPASLGTGALSPIAHWPDDNRLEGRGPTDPLLDTVTGDEPLVLGLTDSLQVAAFNSREYQTQKESVFTSALALSDQAHEFHTHWASILSGDLQSNLSSNPRSRETGVIGNSDVSATRQFQNGISITTAIGLDVVKLLTAPHNSSKGVYADTSISIPLMRGSGRFVVAEPLIQAERNTLYSLLGFERFKRTFAVQVASEFLQVLQSNADVEISERNYRSLISATRQLKRLAEAGRLPELEVDQAVQSELRARDQWINSIQSFDRSLDRFRFTLGLPPDAKVDLELGELQSLSANSLLSMEDLESEEEIEEEEEKNALTADSPITLILPTREEGGPLELNEDHAIRLALDNRLDLQVAEGGVYDAQRSITIAADALRAELTLLGSAGFGERRNSLGSAALPSSTKLDTSDATYSALLTLDLPLDRHDEALAYRESWITLQEAVRQVQSLEDQIKLDIRDRLRTLVQTREEQRIQTAAVALAHRRVDSTMLFLEAGRAQTRDLLDAQESLVSAETDLVQSLVAYRVAELEIQRDMGLLDVSSEGLWSEFQPGEEADAEF